MHYVLLGLAILVAPLLAYAAGTSDLTTADAIDGVVAAVKNGKWAVAIGFLLVALTQLTKYVVGMFKKEIPPNAQPWIAAAIGVVGTVGLTLSAGVVWWEAVISGVVFGATAGGLWSMVVKHMSKKK